MSEPEKAGKETLPSFPAQISSGWAKIRVYLTFTALAVFFAEAAGGNYPAALLNPLIYPAYGVPFILLLDDLSGAGEDRFHPWYFSGWLVGWITETYAAKVVFYGWPGDSQRYAGFAIGPILLVVFFYHAWISFILPAYVARRWLGFPFRISITPFRDRLAFATAFFLGCTSTHISISRGVPFPRTILEFAISTMILLFFINRTRKIGKIEDLRLTQPERSRVIKWGLVIYVLFLFGGATEPHVKGQLAPFWPCVFATGITVFIWVLVKRSTRLKIGIDQAPTPSYDSQILNSLGWEKWLLAYSLIVCLVILGAPIIIGHQISNLVTGFLGISLVFGVICSLYSIFQLFRDSFR